MDTKSLIDIMRENDTNIGAMLFTEEAILSLIKMESWPNKDEIHAYKERHQVVTSIYEKIDWGVQTEETGLSILRRTKTALDEFTPLYFSLLSKVEEGTATTADISPRLSELIEELKQCSRKYGNLPAYKNYRMALKNYGGLGRAEWFKQGKPHIEQYDLSKILDGQK